jgi:hypothetical protein
MAQQAVNLYGDQLARHVNDELGRLSPPDSADPVPFFCECTPGCFHPVWLSVTEYDSLVADTDAPLLSAGHVGSGLVNELVPA